MYQSIIWITVAIAAAPSTPWQRHTIDDSSRGADGVRVRPSFPNPFHSQTTIAYHLPEPAEASVVVYDVRGRQVRTLEDPGSKPAGWHHVPWDGRNQRGDAVPAGVYFYRVRAGTSVKTGKVTMTR